ncbi:uncharacterized protein BX663DRAFT_546004 [Cokeromyces recurvatus]|uniref:uncharacterized protein n=1 Tax=Cokeromyces recurvatus TaxID=90255 RepID=UPI00221E71A9|nr:uncharacterized protein BX663DRAFT_546004 [Cokeromyces recurvatus]KAI7899012.1 hypothetical protein BX663DRAFT_546004 [Cokeromyces recurvatus]
MKETSVVKHKKVLVFTKNDRSRRSSHFRTLRKSTKPSMVESAEALLSKTPSSTVDVVKFVDYIKTRLSVGNLMLQQRHISERLDDRVKNRVLELVEKMIADEEVNLKQHISELLEKLQVLPFRKLKFSSKIFYDQNDQMLVKRLKKKYGYDTILVIANQEQRSHSNAEEKPLPSKVFKIDEYKTSSCCPTCESSLETFKTVANPRPHKRAAKMPTVKCHGLLRCKNRNCLLANLEQVKEIPRKLWNRDMAAVLNFRKILMSLRETGYFSIILLFSEEENVSKSLEYLQNSAFIILRYKGLF